MLSIVEEGSVFVDLLEGDTWTTFGEALEKEEEEEEVEKEE